MVVTIVVTIDDCKLLIIWCPVTAYCSIMSRLNADVNRTSTRPMMTLTVSSYSLLFYHVQIECGSEQNICSTDDDLDSCPATAYCSIMSRLNAEVNRTSARPMMTLTVSSYSLLFYHVQIECGSEQNICSTDDDLDSVQLQPSVLSRLNADVNRTPGNNQTNLTVGRLA
ncbi:hypothetical protein J6590_066029 [Homalodisca vitripennis]|nr:hypothetical protein J6590_066029 [Homalodisca vitripennis]